MGCSLVGRAAGFDPVCWVGSNPATPAKPCKLTGKLTDSESVIIGPNPIEAANYKYFKNLIDECDMFIENNPNYEYKDNTFKHNLEVCKESIEEVTELVCNEMRI